MGVVWGGVQTRRMLKYKNTEVMLDAKWLDLHLLEGGDPTLVVWVADLFSDPLPIN